MCQSYVDAIAKVKPAVLDKYGLRLIIVSNGSWKMIKGYKKLLGDRCPYPIYTDRGKHVYTAMGMTLRTFNAGKDSEKGDYIPAGMMAMTMRGIVQGLALPMKPPGDQAQLGGEFVLGPGLKVTYAHRMKSTRGHADPDHILASMDIDLKKENDALQPTPVVPTPHLGMFSSGLSMTSTGPSRRVSDASAQTPRLSTEPSLSPASQPGSTSTTHTATFANSDASSAHKFKLSPKIGSWREKRKTSRLHKVQEQISPLGIFSASTAQESQPAPPVPQKQPLTVLHKPKRLSKRKSVLASREEHSQAHAEEMRHSIDRSRSIPHIETPEPVSPMSTTFLNGQRDSGVFQPAPSPLSSGSRQPSDRSNQSGGLVSGLLQVPPEGSPSSADLEASSSHFSSSSEESSKMPLGVGNLAKTIRMHLKVSHGPSGSKQNSMYADDASINSRGSLRVRSREPVRP